MTIFFIFGGQSKIMKIYRVRKKERVDFKRALESWLFTTPLHSIMCMSFFFYSESPWIEEEVFKEEVLSDECKYAHLRICFACSTNNCDFSCVGWISFFKNPKFEYGFTPPQNSLIMSISWQDIFFSMFFPFFKTPTVRGVEMPANYISQKNSSRRGKSVGSSIMTTRK